MLCLQVWPILALADYLYAQTSQTSPPIFSANSLENGPPPVSFQSLLGRLTRPSSKSDENIIPTSVNSPSLLIGSLGSSLEQPKGSESRADVSNPLILKREESHSSKTEETSPDISVEGVASYLTNFNTKNV